MNEKRSFIVGIDIGSSSVSMIVGERIEQNKITIIGEASASVGGGVIDGKIENTKTVGDAILKAKKEIEESCNITISSAYVGLSSPYIRCEFINVSTPIHDIVNREVTEADIEALNRSMNDVNTADNREKIIDRMLVSYTLDNKDVDSNNIIGLSGNFLTAHCLFVICQQSILDKTNIAMKNAGIEVKEIFSNATVTPQLFLSEGERTEGAALLNIGADLTSLSIVKGSQLQYFLTFALGGRTIDNDLKTLGIAPTRVEKYKKGCGAAIATVDMQNNPIEVQVSGQKSVKMAVWNLVSAVQARLQDIADYTKKSISRAMFSTKIPCGITITGGTSKLDEIDKLFTAQIDIPSKVATQLYGNCDDSQENINFALNGTATAIMLYGAERGNCDVRVENIPQQSATIVPKEVVKVEPTKVEPRAEDPKPVATPTPQEQPKSEDVQKQESTKQEEKQVEEPKIEKQGPKFIDRLTNALSSFMGNKRDANDI